MGEAFEFEAYRETIRARSVEKLERDRSARGLAALAADLAAEAEATLRERQDPGESRYVECRPGCGTCCVVNVSVLLPEAVAVADYVRGNFSPAQVEALQRRLADLHVQTHWLDDEERVFLRRPCAFLDPGGLCSIYPVRPLLCRSVTSADAAACRGAVTLWALGESVTVPMNLFQKSLMEATYQGLGAALGECGLDPRGRRLTGALKSLLEKSLPPY